VAVSAAAQNSLREAAFGKPKLCSGTNLSPNASLLRKARLALFSRGLMFPTGLRIAWLVSGSVANAAWRVVSVA